MDQKINAAVVGYGLSGKAFHAPFIHSHSGFELSQVVERSKHESQKRYPYVQVVRDLDAVLQTPSIDLVAVCTPNPFHFEQARAILEAGKHVVIEKPFMNTTEECDNIIQLAQKCDRRVFVYQNRRWDGDFLTIKKILDSGVLGDLQYYEAHFDRYNPTRTRAAWRDEEKPGSGILYDLGPHLIDQAVQLFGMPTTISATVEAQREGSRVDDHFDIFLAYPNLEVRLTAGMLVEEPDLRYLLHGSFGSFVKYGLDPQESLLRKDALPTGKDWGKEDPKNYGLITLDDEGEDFDGVLETVPGNYMAFYDNVYDVLTKDADQAVTPEEARNVIRLIECAFESSKENREIEVTL